MIKKIRLLSLAICVAVLFVGCGDKKVPASTETESTENQTETETTEEDKWTHKNNHVKLSVSDGPEPIFHTVPMYFQQEFLKVENEAFNVAKQGGLITCLSMLDSFYECTFNTPDIFMEKYKEYFREDGTYNAEELISAVARNNYRKMYKFPFTVDNLAEYVGTHRYAVLVHINHPSIYGNSSSYIIVTGITMDGQLYVRDPNKDNIKLYAQTEEGGETIYNSFDLVFSAGSNATIYVLGGGLD